MATSGRLLAGLQREYSRSYLARIKRLANMLMSTSAWVFFFLPEVKDRSLEEIDEMVSLTHLVPVPRKS